MSDRAKTRKHQPGTWDDMARREYLLEGGVCWHEMPVLQSELAAGKQFALMLAIFKCAQRGQPIPSWAARAFSTGFLQVYDGRARSWDEVFGLPRPKHMHAHKVARRRELRWKIYNRVTDGKPDDCGIGVELFDRIAKEFATSRKNVSVLYYEAKKLLKRMDVRELDAAGDPIWFTDEALNLQSDPDPILDCDDPELLEDKALA